MSKPTHTPGPWIIIEAVDEVAIVGANKFKVTSMYFMEEYQKLDLINFKLISAAPDLLEALEACLDNDSGNLDSNVVLDAIKAINKAKGVI